MLWFYLAVVNVLLLSVSALLQKILMREKESDAYVYALAFQLIVTGVVSLYAFWEGFHLPNMIPLLPSLGLLVVLYGFANVVLFRAFQLSEASEIGVISSSRSLWTILVAVTFLGETLTSRSFLGILLVVSGVAFISWKSRRFRLQKGHLFALLAAVLFGVAFANDAYLLRSFDAPSYTAFAFFLPSVFLMLIKPQAIKKMKVLFELGRLWKMLVLAIFYGGAAIAIYSSYKVGGQASQIAPISQSSAVVTVLLAAIFLKEKDYLLRKIVGAIAVFLGVLLLK